MSWPCLWASLCLGSSQSLVPGPPPGLLCLACNNRFIILYWLVFMCAYDRVWDVCQCRCLCAMLSMRSWERPEVHWCLLHPPLVRRSQCFYFLSLLCLCFRWSFFHPIGSHLQLSPPFSFLPFIPLRCVCMYTYTCKIYIYAYINFIYIIFAM